LGTGKLVDGKLTLSWQVLDPGAGVKGWRIATKTLGRKGGWVDRARGSKATEATVKLPAGHRYRVRFTLTDLAGHTTTYALGKVTVPRAGRG
jgi:predicted transcriptional regulator